MHVSHAVVRHGPHARFSCSCQAQFSCMDLMLGCQVRFSCTVLIEVTENHLTGLLNCDNDHKHIFSLTFPHLSGGDPEFLRLHLNASLTPSFVPSAGPQRCGAESTGGRLRQHNPPQPPPPSSAPPPAPPPPPRRPPRRVRGLRLLEPSSGGDGEETAAACVRRASPAPPPTAAPPSYPVKSYSQSRTPNSCADRARSVCRHKNGHRLYVPFFSSPASRTGDRLFQDKRRTGEDDCMSPSFSFSSQDGNIFILKNLFFRIDTFTVNLVRL